MYYLLPYVLPYVHVLKFRSICSLHVLYISKSKSPILDFCVFIPTEIRNPILINKPN